jgi:hypothetical protein
MDSQKNKIIKRFLNTKKLIINLKINTKNPKAATPLGFLSQKTFQGPYRPHPLALGYTQ